MKKRMSALLTVILMLGCLGCERTSRTIYEEQYPTNYSKFSDCIGQKKDVVSAKLPLSEENQVVRALYKMPEPEKFLSATYDVYLGIDESSNTVASIQYKKTIQNNLDAAVRDVKELQEYVIHVYGATKEGVTSALTKQKDVRSALLEQQAYSEYIDITAGAPDNIKAYVGDTMRYQFCVSVTSDGGNTVAIEISYRIVSK